jgi:hypothetical protein
MDVITDLTCKDGTARHLVDGRNRLIIARSQVETCRACRAQNFVRTCRWREDVPGAG